MFELDTIFVTAAADFICLPPRKAEGRLLCCVSDVSVSADAFFLGLPPLPSLVPPRILVHTLAFLSADLLNCVLHRV